MEFKLHNQMFDTPKEQTKCSTRNIKQHLEGQ